MRNYVCVIITHGNLAAELNNVAQKFFPLDIPVLTYSNQQLAIDVIVLDINQQLEKYKPEKIILFVDLLGGSCWQAAMLIKKNHENCAIITGINIPVLVSFATNVERLEWPQLLNKLEEDAKKAIKVVT